MATTIVSQNGFTLSLFDSDEESRGYGNAVTLRNYNDAAPLRAKVAKAAQYLGPWCSRCGKRGKNCRNRSACTLRVIDRHKVPAISGREQERRYRLEMAALLDIDPNRVPVRMAA